jgi:RHS repeat-associated protein
MACRRRMTWRGSRRSHIRSAGLELISSGYPGSSSQLQRAGEREGHSPSFVVCRVSRASSLSVIGRRALFEGRQRFFRVWSTLTLIVMVTIGMLVPITLVIVATPAAAAIPSQWTEADPPTGTGGLNSVSCVSSSYCWSVGAGAVSGGGSTTEAELWNGSSWTQVATPDDALGGVLNAVTCLSTTVCWAVGNATYPAIQWNGAAWVAGTQPPTTIGDPLSVSCPTANQCLIVGQRPGSGGSVFSAAEWNGAAWTDITPSSNPGSVLNSVTCLSTTDCWAVGYTTPSSLNTLTAALHWNGSVWTQFATPNPAIKINGVTNYLNSVTCLATNNCWAVGGYDSIELDPSLAIHWNGSAWTQVQTPDDSKNSIGFWQAGDAKLLGVSCLSSTDCWAVGGQVQALDYIPTGEATWVLNWNGTQWQQATTPPSGTPNYDPLNGVSCLTGTGCVLVGTNSSTEGSTVGTALAIIGQGGALPLTVNPEGSPLGADQQGGGGGAEPYCGCSSGDPVNDATGDYYETATDLTLPGAGLPLTFARTYDAKAAQSQAAAAGPAGPLGYGWTDNLGMSVAYNSGTGLATVTQANGSQLTFQYYAMGATEPVGSNGVTWCPSDATTGVFCPTAPRYIATLAQAVGGAWTFVNDVKSPITYTFTSGGSLSEIADAAGDTLVSSAYTPGAGQAPCPSGDTCTAWSSTPSGESSPSAVLVEAFNSSSQLVSVFDAASGAASTQVATFAYSGSGCSTWSGTPADLCTVTDPGSLTTTFNYDTGKSSPFQYDETAMSPPATGKVTNTYNSSGQISKQVITTGATNAEQDFAYGASSKATNGTQTVVTSYPNGPGGTSTTATYVFSNAVEVAETDGAGVTTYVNRDPSTLLATNAVDGNNNITSTVFDNYASTGGTPASSADATMTTDAMGNSSQTLFTSGNLPYCSMDAADYAWGQAQGTPVSCPTTPPTTPPTGPTRYTTNIYNAANELTFTTDPLGKTTANSYTVSGVGVPAGLLYCTVDPADYAKSVACPAYGAAHIPGTATKTFDATGDVLTSTDADGNVTTYVYGSAANPGLATQTTDPDGTVTTNSYNGANQVIQRTQTTGNGGSPAGTTSTVAGGPMSTLLARQLPQAAYQVQTVTLGGTPYLYLADQANSVIRRIDLFNDEETVVAGNYDAFGYFGDGAAATSASLGSPDGVAVDAAGDVAIADTGNNAVRFIPAASGTYFNQSMTAGDIYTIAGNGTAGSSGNGGVGTSAELSGPESVVFDGSGVAIADTANNAVRFVAQGAGTYFGQPLSAGEITAIAGNGTAGSSGDGAAATSAELHAPGGVAVDSAGDLAIADTGNSKIRFIPLTTATFYGQSMTAEDIYTVAGNGSCGYSNGAATSSQMCSPGGVSFDAGGDLVIADTDNQTVRFVPKASGSYYGQSMMANDIYTIAGNDTWGNSGDGGAATSAELGNVVGVATDPSGDVLVADLYNSEVRAVAASSGTLAGQPVTADDIYTVAGNGPDTESHYSGPPANTELNGPSSVRTDAVGDVVLTDTGNNAVRFIPVAGGTYFGQSMTAHDIYTIAGNNNAGYNGDGGAATAAELNGPTSASFDSGGDIVIGDTSNSVVRFVPTTSGTFFGQSMSADDIYTIAGNGTAGSSGDGGAATSAELGWWIGVSIDAAGLAIADSTNNVVRFVPTTTGTYYGQSMTADHIYAIAGNGTVGYSGDGGPATSAKLSGISLASLDGAGDLAIADSSNNVIRFVPVTTGTYYGQSRTANDIYTIAGNGTGGYSGDGGAATSAELSDPGDATFDGAGDLFIADSGNDVVRFVPKTTGTSYGQAMGADDIYTIAGQGWSNVHFSGDGGPPLSAEFAWIASAAPDGSGGYYIADQVGERLRHVSVGGASGTGATTLNAYDSAGRKFCEVDPYEYSQSVRCPGTPPTSPPTGTPGYTDTIYSSNGQVTSTTSPIGGTTQYAYDGAGNKYCTVSPTNYASGTRCPTSLPLTTPTVGSDSYLGATIDTFDANNRVVQVTNPLGGITLSNYDGAGNLLRSTVESNNSTSAPNIVTAYTYDGDNRMISTTNGSGSASPATTLANYDPNGNAFCSVSANADAAGTSAYQCPTWQSAWIVAPPSPTALYSTSPSPSQGNNVTTNFFNADGTQVQTTNPDVQTSITATDADGRTYCTSDPSNVSAWLTANPSGTYPYLCPGTPPTTAPTGTTGYNTTIFDAAGRTLSSTDQVGDTTTTAYDPAGHTTTTTDPRGKVTTNCYYWQSGTGQCAASAPAGGGSPDDLYSTTTPATSVDPLGETTTYTYYPGDKADTTTTPAGTTTDSYDASSDLTGVAFSGATSEYSIPTNQSYTFNVDGTRHTMVDASGTTTYSYDANGDTTNQAFVAGGGTGLANNTVVYGYFTTGVQSSVTYPTYSGHTSPAATYTYDALGMMASETDWLGNKVTFSHDGNGNQTSQNNAVSTSNPNGTSGTASSYDNAGLNSQATSTLSCSGTNGTVTQSFSGSTGSRNADGQVTRDSATYGGSCAGPSTYQRNYSYDSAGRVVYQGTVAQGASASNIGYDASGDPTTISNHDSTGSFDTYTQTYDNAGEVAGQTPKAGSGGVSATYTNDTLGDQTQAVAGSTTSSYGYNQIGQMTSATPNSAGYLYTGDGLEAASTTSSASTVWSPPTDVDSTRAIDAVTCVSTTFCVAVGASGYATTYNGTSWSTPTDADSTRTMDAVTCVSTTFCVAVDTAGYATTYNGTSWLTPTDIDGSRSVNAVTCVSTTFCVAVGASGYAATYTGSWASATDIDSTRTMDAISCTSSTFCVAVDTSGYSGTYTGSWATATDIDGSRSIDTVTCVSTTFCVAAGASGYATAYNGTLWAPATDLDSTRTIKSVACPTSSSCVAVDTSGYATTYNGSSWAPPTDIDGSHALEALSCASSTSCDATDNAGNALTYNGSSWSPASNIDSTRSINSVSCTSASFCVAADGSGFAAVYAPSSLGWSPPTAIDSTRAVDAVTCVSTTFCVAVGASGYATTYNGTSWSTPTDADSTRTMDAVSCTSSTFCVAVDTSGYATKYNGTSWSTPTDIDGSRSINAVACTSTTFCVAVGASGYAAKYTGSWASATDIDSTRTMDAISCTSSTFCVAVDTSGYSGTYTGSWATATDIDGSRSIDTVTCVSTTFCVAAGASGYAAKYTGSWASATDIDSTRTIKSVACPTSSSCVAVDTSGYATTYNGTSWAAPTDIDGSAALEAVSCVSSTSCDATDNSGEVLTYNGSAWSTPTDIDAARSVNAVSCVSASFCVAADGSGYAAVYHPLLTTAANQLIWDTNGSVSQVLSDSTNDYIYGPTGEPVEQVNLSSSTPTYLAYTASDSSWLATNNAGQQVAFWRYDAFGNLATGTPDSPFGYSGQYSDASTGLVNDRARFYESQTGGFTTRDPAFASTDTAYTYAAGDPVNNSDPSGLCKSTSVSCRYDNLIWQDEIRQNGGQPLGVSGTEAENFLVSNNFPVAQARGFVDSFSGGIQIGLAQNFQFPLYRYYGGKSPASGFFFSDRGNYASPTIARDALALRTTGNTASTVARAVPNNGYGGAPLVLFGMVAGGKPMGAVQFMAYDKNEFLVGPGVPTGSGNPLDAPFSPPWIIEIEPESYTSVFSCFINV